MKILTYVSSITLAATLATSAHAGQKSQDARHITTIFASSIAGAAVAGPVGMLVGAFGGSFVAKKNQDTYDEKVALAQNVATLENDLASQTLAVEELENRMAKKLEFQVMFPTGVDELTEQDQQRIQSLAKYLKKNPQLQVRLDGHADPRGTDEYNNVLSAERAKSVAAALTSYGIDEERISVNAHGASFAVTAKGSSDQFALERRVHIEVFQEGQRVATNP